MNPAPPRPAQIWRDDCYYLDRSSGQGKPKYLLIIALHADGDVVTAVFTSKSHGLLESPACSHGPPRAGYFVGTPGGVLTKPTWVDFSSLQDVDSHDFRRWQGQQRVSLLPRALSATLFCGVLRCLQGHQDTTGRQQRLIGDLIGAVGCP